MGSAAGRGLWRTRVEQCPASGLTNKEWRKLSKMAQSSFNKWAARFRETEPELFGKPNATQWFEPSRDDVKAQTASVPVSMENNTSTVLSSLAGDDAPSSCQRHPSQDQDRSRARCSLF